MRKQYCGSLRKVSEINSGAGKIFRKTRHSVRPEVVENRKKKKKGCSIQQTSKTSRSLSSSISAIFQRVVRVLFVCRFLCIGPCKGGPLGARAKKKSTSHKNSGESSLGLIHHTVFASAEQLQEISRNTDRRADYMGRQTAL